MSVKYLVGGGNTFFITRCPKIPSLILRIVHHILRPSHCVKHSKMGNSWCVFWNTYMLRGGEVKKHAGGILQPSHSPRCVCATKIRYLHISGDTDGGHMFNTRGASLDKAADHQMGSLNYCESTAVQC